MGLFAAIVRPESSSVAVQKVAGHPPFDVARGGDNSTYQYCVFYSDDKGSGNDVVSALLSFPVVATPGPVARIYAVPKYECATGIEIFQESQGKLTVRVGGNDATRFECESKKKLTGSACPREPDSDLELRGSGDHSKKASHQRECVVRLSWNAKAKSDGNASYLLMTYQFPEMPYQTSFVNLSPNAAIALLNARVLELTMYAAVDRAFPRIAALRWGARGTGNEELREIEHLKKATELARQRVQPLNLGNFTDYRVSNALKAAGRFELLAEVLWAHTFYANKFEGKGNLVQCTTQDSSGNRVITTCANRSNR